MPQKVLIATFIFLLASCNVAEQVPIDSSAAELNSSNSGALGANDSYVWFNSPGASVNEGNGSVYIYLKRTSEFSSEAQSVYLKLSGDADSSDYQTIKQNGVPLTVTSGVFSLEFAAGSSILLFEVALQDESVYEPNELMIFEILPEMSGKISKKTYSSFQIKIVNDDPLPSMTFDFAGSTVLEGFSKNIVMSLSNPSYKETRALVKNVGGAAGTSDHDFANQYVAVPAGALSSNIFVLAKNDVFAELDETLELEVLPSIGLDYPAARSVHTLTIQEAGTSPSFEFDQISATINESGSYIVQVNFTGNYDHELHLPFSVAGTAAIGKDYTLSKQYFTLPVGANTATVTLSPLDDSVFEEDETVVLTLQDQTFGLAGTNSSTTVTLQDNEAAPTVGFGGSAYSSEEGATVYLPIELSTVAGDDIDLAFSVDAASSASASDYALAFSGSITISAGTKRFYFPVKLNKDTNFEGTESLILNLDSVVFANYAAVPALGTAQTILNIKETSDQPVLNFSTGSLAVNEGGGSFNVTVELDKASDVNLDFSVDIKAQSADSSDYTTPALAHTILAGSASYTFSVTLIDDNIQEPRESLTFNLLQPSNVTLGSVRQLIVDIEDDDVPSSVTLSASAATVAEGVQGYFEATLDKASGYDIVIPVSFSGAATEEKDYIASASSFIIPAGDISARIFIDVISDGSYDAVASEDIQLDVQAGSSYTLATTSATTDILDAQAAPQLSFSASAKTGLEGDLLNAQVELEHPTYKDIEVEISFDDNYNTATCNAACADVNDDPLNPNFLYDVDIYKIMEAGVVKLTIPAGKTKAAFSFKIFEDKIDEDDDERFNMVVSNIDSGDFSAASIDGANGEMEISIIDLHSTTPPTPPELSPSEGIYNVDFSVAFSGSLGNGTLVYHYTIDSTAPTCSSTSGSSYDHDILAAPDANGDAFTLRVVACDALGNQSAETSGVYTFVDPQMAPFYDNAANWNDYAMDKEDAASAICDGADGSNCFHGGKVRRVDLLGVDDCAGLSLSDNLGAFHWQCELDTATIPNHVYFVNTAFTLGRGLKDLIDAASTDWRDMSLSLSGQNVINDPIVGTATKPWSNAIQDLPINGAALEFLAVTGGLYIYDSDFSSAGFEITADKVGIVKMGNFQITRASGMPDNCFDRAAASAQCLIFSNGARYLWISANLDGFDGADQGDEAIELRNVNFSQITNTSLSNFDKDALSVESSNGNRFNEVKIANSGLGGFYLLSSSNNKFHNILASNTVSGAGVELSFSHNNVFVGATSANNVAGLNLTSSNNNILMGITAANNDTNGVELNSSSDNTVMGAAAYNNASGLVISNGENNYVKDFSSSNTTYNIELAAGATPNIFSGALKLGNATTSNCFTNAGSGLVDGTCANEAGSDAILTTGVDLSTEFKGDLQSALRSDISPDWFDATTGLFQAWGSDGKGSCDTGEICHLWDWSLKDSAAIARDVRSLPTAEDFYTHTWSAGGTTTFLINAREATFQSSLSLIYFGNDNFLCEANESCSLSQNISSYQGEDGTIIYDHDITTGTISPVEIWIYGVNGAPP